MDVFGAFQIVVSDIEPIYHGPERSRKFGEGVKESVVHNLVQKSKSDIGN